MFSYIVSLERTTALAPGQTADYFTTKTCYSIILSAKLAEESRDFKAHIKPLQTGKWPTHTQWHFSMACWAGHQFSPTHWQDVQKWGCTFFFNSLTERHTFKPASFGLGEIVLTYVHVRVSACLCVCTYVKTKSHLGCAMPKFPYWHNLA